MSLYLKRLARQVKNVLSRYIEIHDALNNVTMRHWLPIPGVFKRIPFDVYAKDLSGLLAAIENLRFEIRENPKADTAFADVLEEYSQALQVAIEKLQRFCLNLAQQARGGTKYNFFKQKSDYGEYAKAVKRYVILGEKLNLEFNRISGRFN